MALSIASSLSRPSLFRFIPKTTKFTSPSILTFLTTINPKYPTRSRFVSSSSAMASESKESPSNNPGLHTTPDEATKSYFMQQTMFRIKDPKVSLDFYSRVLGMSLLKRLDFPEMKVSLYFMGYEDLTSAPRNAVDLIGVLRVILISKATIMGTQNLVALGHIGVNVDDTYKACGRFEHLGVEFVKKPDDDKSYMMIVKAGCITKTLRMNSCVIIIDVKKHAMLLAGKMKGIAFIKDPDGYWIEIFDLKTIGSMTSGAA
ncbi:unnamed protein product [Camellia sinensis]